MTEELSDTILKSPIENLILKIAQKQGMLTMAQEGIIKVFAGQTTIDEVIRVTQEI
ncbi:MAG: Type IV pilus assembly protein PilB [Parcubacteria group bacterium GW2011_GWA1_33_6]|nr:MAG: Type IV pilus assembly protein PilB [Parcubacteria group bacterium GW2011_GWA1_33_6]